MMPGAHGTYLGVAESPPPSPALFELAVGTIEKFLAP
jgi:hypothetical protein